MMILVILLMMSAFVNAEMCKYSDDIYDSQMYRCYHFPYKMLGLDAAERYCHNIGYGLASIHNEAQNSRLIENAVVKFFGNAHGSDTFYTGGKIINYGSEFSWLDGTNWDYSNWSFGEPIYDTLLVNVSDGSWYTTSSNYREQYFICEGYPTGNRGSTGYPGQSTGPYRFSTQAPYPAYPATTTRNWPYQTPTASYARTTNYNWANPSTARYPRSTTWPVYTHAPPGTTRSRGLTTQPTTCIACQDGWTYFGEQSSCYSTLFASNWDSAKFLCREIGAELVSIHSYAENAFVARLTQTGMTATSTDQQTWIGLNYESGLWRWSDGSRIDFINWAAREPIDPSTKKCATRMKLFVVLMILVASIGLVKATPVNSFMAQIDAHDKSYCTTCHEVCERKGIKGVCRKLGGKLICVCCKSCLG